MEHPANRNKSMKNSFIADHRNRSLEYVAHIDLASFCMLPTDNGLAAATAALLRTARGFWGSEVPAAGIAHVAIAPEARGRGLARPIVDALCEEPRSEGALIVSLFGSARPVYSKRGFELAGSEIVYEASTTALPAKTDVDFFQLQPGDERIRQEYAAKAKSKAGLLRRSDAHWSELLRATDGLAAFATGGDRLRAYIILDIADSNVVEIWDWHAENGALASALLCFVSRFRSVYPTVRWHDDDLVAAMPDKGWHLDHREAWMARILEPEGALERRGYAIESAVLGIPIADPGMEPRELRVEIASGMARVTHRNNDDIPTASVDGPSFTTLFIGFRSTSKLARRPPIRQARRRAMCNLAFAGPLPWVAEHF
jgi:predicted acetyltransferase